MRNEVRVMRRYLFRDHYAFVVMEAVGLRETVLFYIQGEGSDELLFVKRVSGCTIDDEVQQLREVEAMAETAMKKYENAFGQAPGMTISSSALPGKPEPVRPAAPEAPAETQQPRPAAAAPAPAAEKPAPKKKFMSKEDEEKERARSLAMLQKNSFIDFRYNRQGNAVAETADGSQAALVSDVFSVIGLFNRRLAEDIRPILLDCLPYYHNNDFDLEYELSKNKETTIRYRVNEDGLMTACTVSGEKYPVCRTILQILRRLSENAEEGADSFHDRIISRIRQDMDRERV